MYFYLLLGFGWALLFPGVILVAVRDVLWANVLIR